MEAISWQSFPQLSQLWFSFLPQFQKLFPNFLTRCSLSSCARSATVLQHHLSNRWVYFAVWLYSFTVPMWHYRCSHISCVFVMILSHVPASLFLCHLIMSVLFRAYKYEIKLAHAVAPPLIFPLLATPLDQWQHQRQKLLLRFVCVCMKKSLKCNKLGQEKKPSEQSKRRQRK